MLFSSLSFLFCFFPLVVLTYFVLRPALQNYFLLLASLLFYAWGEPKYLLIMLSVIAINYLAGIGISYFTQHKKAILVLSILLNLSILGFFKYTDFIIENINLVFKSNLPLLHIALPIGISFYIFQSMSYTIDVFTGAVQSQKNIFKFALYVSLFPQLIAGPIVKYRDIANEIDNRNVSLQDVVDGLKRFIVGLSKKVILANTMGEVADTIYSTGTNNISADIAWLGAIAYSLQIFFDFSGYSDMAIGIGRMFGFKFLENFNHPYIADSVTDFWRRWHISLSSWFREYLYIPLGGNRVSTLRRNINLFVVFFATGLWHGASWNFIIWGLWHGFFLIVEKYFSKNYTNNSIYKKIIKHIYVILVFIIGWVFFRADNLAVALNYIKVMFCITSPAVIPFNLEYYLTQKVALIGIIALLLCYDWKYPDFTKAQWLEPLKMGYSVLLLIISITFIASAGYNPFIYFRF